MHIFSLACGFYLGYKTHRKFCSMSSDMKHFFMDLDKIREEMFSISGFESFFSRELIRRKNA